MLFVFHFITKQLIIHPLPHRLSALDHYQLFLILCYLAGNAVGVVMVAPSAHSKKCSILWPGCVDFLAFDYKNSGTEKACMSVTSLLLPKQHSKSFDSNYYLLMLVIYVVYSSTTLVLVHNYADYLFYLSKKVLLYVFTLLLEVLMMLVLDCYVSFLITYQPPL